MIKKIAVTALVLCFSLFTLSPSLAQVQDGITVLDSSAEVEFPAAVRFSLSVESGVDVTDIRLRYRVHQDSFARVTSETYIEFMPAAVVDTQWLWDMRKVGGLPPGSSFEYWWVVEDAGGKRLETKPVRVKVEDHRYRWQSLTEGMVTVYWYQGDSSFAQELMMAAQQALARLAEDTGASPKKPVELYIYASSKDLQGAMIYPQEWTGGVAFTRFGIIAIGVAPNELAWGERAIAHELTHLVIHQVTLNPYNDLPTWLDEGLAMYVEGEPEPVYTHVLSKAIAGGSLISVRSLSSPFSAYAEEAILSYAESQSLVKFLIDSYGRDSMLEMLNIFAQGSGYDQALEKVYGFDMDGLDGLWRDYVTGLAD